jgi:hypothetical protein
MAGAETREAAGDGGATNSGAAAWECQHLRTSAPGVNHATRPLPFACFAPTSTARDSAARPTPGALAASVSRWHGDNARVSPFHHPM